MSYTNLMKLIKMYIHKVSKNVWKYICLLCVLVIKIKISLGNVEEFLHAANRSINIGAGNLIKSAQIKILQCRIIKSCRYSFFKTHHLPLRVLWMDIKTQYIRVECGIIIFPNLWVKQYQNKIASSMLDILWRLWWQED